MTVRPQTLATVCCGWFIALVYLVVLCCVLLLLRVPGLILRAVGTVLANVGAWIHAQTNGVLLWIDSRMS